MDWSAVFNAVNLLALVAWVALIVLPRWPALLSGVLYLGIGLLCLIYAVTMIGVVSGLIPNPEGGGADFTTIEGVQAIFATRAGITPTVPQKTSGLPR